MRLFIAVDFEQLDGYFRSIQEIIRPKIKAGYPNSFHCTLKFLGDFDDDKVALVKDKLNDVKFEKFNAVLSNMGFFPSERYVRVIWLGLEPEMEFIGLRDKIDNVLANFKFKNDKFKPHITLARVKGKSDLADLKNIQIEKKEVVVNKFKLFKSTLTSKGAVYETLAEFSA